jgi:hypothetical protein
MEGRKEGMDGWYLDDRWMGAHRSDLCARQPERRNITIMIKAEKDLGRFGHQDLPGSACHLIERLSHRWKETVRRPGELRRRTGPGRG